MHAGTTLHRTILSLGILLISGWVTAQTNYLSQDGRLAATGVLNGESFSVESHRVYTEFNGNSGFILIRFDSRNARFLSEPAFELAEEEEGLELVWTNMIPELDGLVKTDQPTATLRGYMRLVVNGIEREVPVLFTAHRINGMKGRTVIMSITGNFDPAEFEMGREDRKFTGTIDYEVVLTIQAFTF